MLSVRILWAVKILLVLRKASAAGAPLMKGRELQAACIGPGSGQLPVPPDAAEAGREDRLCDLCFPVGKDLLQLESRFLPDALRSGHPDGGRPARSLQHFLVLREYPHHAAFAEGMHGFRPPHAELSVRNTNRRIRITCLVAAEPVQAVAAGSVGRREHRDGTALTCRKRMSNN